MESAVLSRLKHFLEAGSSFVYRRPPTLEHWMALQALAFAEGDRELARVFASRALDRIMSDWSV
jgi:hypothetical protein